MALSGSIVTGSIEGRSVTLNWSATQNVANNQSTINWTVVGSGTYTGYVTVSEIRVSLNGSQIGYVSSATHQQAYVGTTLAAGSTTITHKADGTANAFTLKVEAGIYNWTINTSGSGTFTLNTIPRASTVTIADSSFTLGTAKTITINRASSSFTHILRYSFGNASGVIQENITGTSVSWTPPLSLASQIPNATSGIGTITCETFNNSAGVGTTTTQVAFNVPSSAVPTVSSFSVSPDNSANSVINGWGLYVAGISKVKFTGSATGNNGSTITSYRINDGSNDVTTTSLPMTSGTITKSGTVTYKCYATDSRNRTSSAKSASAITVYPYSVPTATLTTARTSSTAVSIVADWSYSSVNNKNSATAKLYYKLKTATSWTAYSGSITKGGTTALSGTFAETNSYTFRLEITDTVGNKATADSLVSTINVLIDFKAGGKGLGIGKIAETDALEVDIPSVYMQNANFNQLTKFNNIAQFENIIYGNSTNSLAKSSIRILPQVTGLDQNNNEETYYQELLKWICTNYPNDSYVTYIGVGRANYKSYYSITIYDNGTVNSDGLPQYAFGYECSINRMNYIQTNNYVWSFKPMVTAYSDTVVLSGKSGIWTYRKWNSGIAECFSSPYAPGSLAVTTSSWGGYVSGYVLFPDYPFEFVEAPAITFNGSGATSGSNADAMFITSHNLASSRDTKKVPPAFKLWRGTSATLTAPTFTCYAIGKWK